MASKNGSKELMSLLQYMKDTRLDNPEIKVKDERLIELDRIVSEVKESYQIQNCNKSRNVYVYSGITDDSNHYPIHYHA